MDWVKVREQLAFAGARLQALRDFRDSGLSHIEYIPIFMGDELRDDGALTRLVEAMIDLQTRETQLESRYTATNPLLLEVREQQFDELIRRVVCAPAGRRVVHDLRDYDWPDPRAGIGLG